MNLLILVVAVTATAFLSLVGGYALILGKNKFVKFIQKIGPLIAFIVLMYAVFGDLVPEILEEEELTVSELIIFASCGFVAAVLVGFIMGRFHHHSDLHHHDHKKHDIETHGNKEIRNKSQAYTMLAVDSVHAIADGIVLGTSFVAAPSAGVSACLATIAHEIPQEVGDFSIMQRAKIGKKDIIKMQTLSSLVVVPSAIIAYFVGDNLLETLPSVLAVVSGFLLYVAFGQLVCIFESIKDKK